VEKNQQWGVSLARQVIEIEKISVRGVESLESKIQGQSGTHELAPERLQIRSGEPPGWSEGSRRQEVLSDMQSNLFNAK